MPEAKRKDWDSTGDSQSAGVDSSFHAGGDIATLHADLARRLAHQHDTPDFDRSISSTEKAVRFLSQAAGYGALAVAYVAATAAIVFWL